MPLYSNSLLRPGERPAPRCPECDNPRCEGLHALRTFTSWNDLASHLDEADILHFVNRLNDIWVEYVTLKDAHETAVETRAKVAAERSALLTAAKQFIATHPQAPTGAPTGGAKIVTAPMKSRQARQGAVPR